LKFSVSRIHWSLAVLLVWSVGIAQSSITRDQTLKASFETASILVAQARVSASEAQALAANVPISGSANVGYGWTGIDPKPITGSAITGDWTYGAQVNFSGLFGEPSAARVQAGLNLERTKLNLSSTTLKVNKSAINLWHGLRRAEAALETATAAATLAEAQDRASEARLQSGAINVSERETSRIALQSAQLEAARAQNKLEAAEKQLEILLNLKGNTAGDWKALPVPPEAANLERREDLFEARAALVTAQLDLSLAQHAALPSLNLDAGLQGSSGSLGFKLNSDLASGLSFSYPSLGGSGGGTGAGSGSGSGSTTWNLGLSLTIPIDPAKISALPALEQSVRAAEAALQASQKAAKADASAKRAALLLSRAGLKLAEQQLELSKQNLSRNKQRLASGVIPALEVQRAELEVLKARDALFAAQADLDSSVLEVFEAINQPLEAQ
jgi:outer membrane protein TolC